MQTVTDAAALRAAIRAWRSQGQAVGFVPTMGNLHDGHYSLLRIARSRAERVVASVFVNPTQFGPNEDYARYPRTLAQDQAGLAAHGCDLLFAPDVATIYPSGPERTVTVHVPGVTAVLEGAHRPGHFDGVATVVTKLLNLVQPDVAVFGQKDWQQLLVVKALVRDLALPVQIVPGPTMREPDGLAMSSRNQYLGAEERARAPAIHATLAWMRAALRAGHPREVVEAAALKRLEHAGFTPDYAVIRRAEDLAEPAAGESAGLIALIAARLGATRLIDNLPFDGL
ncbi:pantothenate synthetase [Mizugakiibacter sediminis]|uniref:Pantothenate synthetase n=1 Tax=Mizugakiibacter sediminis TaxID=1475481 RepID=A0A0K8QSS2_9GAMM|nr:pantoate--beta-alanine ligase [Mizugakiibacter sediminis]GAP67427.1 pantothenate synthetase [Mizugakiibacter sediminis]